MKRSAVLASVVCMLWGCGGASCPAGFSLSAAGSCVADGSDGGLDGATGDGGPRDAAFVDGEIPDTGSAGDTGTATDTGPRDSGAPDVGTVDASCAATTFYRDSDNDGHGDLAMPMSACAMPSGYVASSDDCDDACTACFPGGTEICDALRDENCTGGIDDGCDCTNGATRPCGTSMVGTCRMGAETCVTGPLGRVRRLGRADHGDVRRARQRLQQRRGQ